MTKGKDIRRQTMRFAHQDKCPLFQVTPTDSFFLRKCILRTDQKLELLLEQFFNLKIFALYG